MGSKRGFCGLLAHFAESPLTHSTNEGVGLPTILGFCYKSTGQNWILGDKTSSKRTATVDYLV
jgi:hypothetical protein